MWFVVTGFIRTTSYVQGLSVVCVACNIYVVMCWISTSSLFIAKDSISSINLLFPWPMPLLLIK